MDFKVCTKCHKSKPVNEFYVRRRAASGRMPYCIVCHKEHIGRVKKAKASGTFVSQKGMPRLTPEQRAVRAIEMRAYQAKYRKDHAEEIRAGKKRLADQAKREGIARYGGKCSCCGESQFEFLTLEHVNGRDKNIKRRTGKTEWLRLKQKGWPSGHTVLCFNCNCAKGAYGSCPHARRSNG